MPNVTIGDGTASVISLEALEQHAAQAAQTIGDSGDNLDAHLDARYALSAACDPATITALVRAVQAALNAAILEHDPNRSKAQNLTLRRRADELRAALAPFRPDPQPGKQP